jgi:hypothetical protein
MKKSLFISLVCVIFFLVSFNCTKTKNHQEVKMKGSVKELVDYLKTKTKVSIIGDEKGVMLAVLPNKGAKVVGMSIAGLEDQNLIWVPESIMADTFWTKPIWNIGGARSWISPEDQFYLDKQNTWFVPESMDPGKYAEEVSEKNRIKCSNTFEIKDKAENTFHVKLTRDIEVLSNPPENLKPEGYNFKYAGMKFTHELENLDPKTIGKDVPYMGLWSLIQLKANGTMIIPTKDVKDPRGANYRNFFNVFTPDRISVKPDNITVKLDGKFRGKIGIAPWAAKELLACIYNVSKDEAILFVKNFSVNPTGKYLDKPWGKPSEYGDAVEMYNDDGKMGGFCEMECHREAKELKQNEKISQTITFSAFRGKKSELKAFAAKLLNLKPEDITYFE